MRVLVVTTVHDPRDSRIYARQIRAMLGAGWSVTYAAAFDDRGVASFDDDRLVCVDVPRAHGRHRTAAFFGARRLIRQLAPSHDLVVLHDPELVVAVVGLRIPPVVWDVHEDTAAALSEKPWLPPALRRVVARVVVRAERWAERHHGLLLAEDAYQRRFERPHPVVPNTVSVPDTVVEPGESTVIYVGSLSAARGAHELVEVGRLLHDDATGPVLRVIGPADAPSSRALTDAAIAGWLRWDGRLPADEAMAALDGAMAGLSLLHDLPNYRVSLPTKVVEYMGHGVPVVTTPLPLAAALVEESRCGVVVAFGDAVATVAAIRRLREAPTLRRDMGAAGHARALESYDWRIVVPRFLTALEDAARPR